MSFDVILRFLRPIAHLIEDPEVSEIMANGSRRTFVWRQGLVREVSGVRPRRAQPACRRIQAVRYQIADAIDVGRSIWRDAKASR